MRNICVLWAKMREFKVALECFARENKLNSFYHKTKKSVGDTDYLINKTHVSYFSSIPLCGLCNKGYS